MSGDQRIGIMQCWSCGKDVPVKKKASGKLSASCSWCDFPHYANAGTEHFANVMKATKLDQAPTIDEANARTTVAAAAKPEPEKAARRASSAPPGFGG